MIRVGAGVRDWGEGLGLGHSVTVRFDIFEAQMTFARLFTLKDRPI